ncbi:M protein, serotype 6-like [Aphis gossypii]|uniref:M protein, serotype 6-like n=1 Tax=Aphis gossypii TaxID=80765 RepID=UPI0021599D83|nr:M protein, serotype 6-like [Aphis gossypii]
MCTNTTNTTNPNQEQEELLLEQQKLTTELSDLQEWINTRMAEQLKLYNVMVVNYDRMLTKLRTCEEELERNRTENARFKFTSQCLMDKINELTSSDGNKSEKVNNDNDKDKDKNPDADPLTAYMEMCTKKLIDQVSAYKEQVERMSIELDDVNDQLAQSALTEDCLKRALDNLTVLAEAERMRRDRDETELRKTVNQLMAELDKVQQEKDKLRSVEAKYSVEMMHNESAQDEALRTENARLQAKLGTSGIVVATLQSKVFDLEKELAKRTSVMHVQQEQSQSPVLDVIRAMEGGSSTSLMLYQCNLSQTGDEHGASFLDLGRGDDQSIPCLLSIKSSGCTAAEDMTQSSSQSTNDDRQPSNSESTDDDRQPCSLSCSQSSTVQEECSSETTAEPSLAEFRLNRLSYIIKKYESKHEDIS